jgi:hypothetical protein
MKHEELRQKALSNKNVKKEFNFLEPEYALVRRMLAARKKAGLTQADVAQRMGTKTPAIIHNGEAVPIPSQSVAKSDSRLIQHLFLLLKPLVVQLFRFQ